MADADCAPQALSLIQHVAEDFQPSLGFGDFQFFTGIHRHTGGIVPPVLQFFQSLQKQGCRLFFSNIPDNSAHGVQPPLSGKNSYF